ncbi:MAG: tyrosine recombinase [Chloroflexota bacterium]
MEEQLFAFLTYLEREYQYSENTIAAYRNDLSQFAQFIEQRTGSDLSDFSAVSQEQVSDYLTYMKHKEQPYASSTIARKVAALKSFFNYLTSKGIIEQNPTINIDSPKVKKRLPQALSLAEVERLLEAPNEGTSPKSLRDRALLNTLYDTGMRVTEIVSLQVSDVDLGKSVLFSPTRQGVSRDIPINDDTKMYLIEYLTDGRPHLMKNEQEQALFLNHRGEMLTRQGLWLIIKGYAREAGLQNEVTPHTLRHSFAVHRINKGSDLEDIQRLLGHANISTTQIYTQMETAEEPVAS